MDVVSLKKASKEIPISIDNELHANEKYSSNFVVIFNYSHRYLRFSIA